MRGEAGALVVEPEPEVIPPPSVAEGSLEYELRRRGDWREG